MPEILWPHISDLIHLEIKKLHELIFIQIEISEILENSGEIYNFLKKLY